VVETVLTIFKAIAAIPEIIDQVKQFAQGVMIWYVSQAEEKTLRAIADAAALGARATNPEERRAALDKWREALSRPKVSP